MGLVVVVIVGWSLLSSWVVGQPLVRTSPPSAVATLRRLGYCVRFGGGGGCSVLCPSFWPLQIAEVPKATSGINGAATKTQQKQGLGLETGILVRTPISRKSFRAAQFQSDTPVPPSPPPAPRRHWRFLPKLAAQALGFRCRPEFQARGLLRWTEPLPPVAASSRPAAASCGAAWSIPEVSRTRSSSSSPTP